MRTQDTRPPAPALALALALALAASPALAAELALCDRCLCSGGALLDCTGRGLRDIPADRAAWLGTAEDARLDQNDLVRVRPLPPLPQLQRLSLRRNRIQVVDDSAFANLTALRELDLGDNELTRVTMRPHMFQGQYAPPAYMPLANLTVLLLDYNAIHSLPSDAFEHLPALERLSLAGNPLRLLDAPTEQALAALPKLTALDLAFCQLAALPERMLHGPANLSALNLTGNLFTAVPADALAAAHQLRELRLSQNPILELGADSFPGSLRSLRSLELHYLLNLTWVRAGALAPLRQLQALELAHCAHLTEIHPQAFASAGAGGELLYPPLRKLMLRGNALRRLTRDMLPRWDNLTEVDLQDNMWECACEEQWMVDELEPLINSSRPDLLRNVICEFPEPMRGLRLFDLHARRYHLRCEDAYGARPDRDAMLMVGVLVGVLMAVPATVAAVLIWRRGLPWFRSGRSVFTRAAYRRADSAELF